MLVGLELGAGGKHLAVFGEALPECPAPVGIELAKNIVCQKDRHLIEMAREVVKQGDLQRDRQISLLPIGSKVASASGVGRKYPIVAVWSRLGRSHLPVPFQVGFPAQPELFGRIFSERAAQLEPRTILATGNLFKDLTEEGGEGRGSLDSVLVQLRGGFC